MTDPNQTVEPVSLFENGTIAQIGGLTKREYFALEFAKELIKKEWASPVDHGVQYADILIAKLNSTQNVNYGN